MKKHLKKILSILILAIFLFSDPAMALFNPQARLQIKNLQFCAAKPSRMGRFKPVSEKGTKVGDDVYLYMEAQNCRSKRKGKNFSLYLIADMDIYHEDGMRIYSQKDVKSFMPESARNMSAAMLWIKIETIYLKAGEYKVELTIKDEYSEKTAFVIGKFMAY